jgi:outer membrane protein assembly factor BamD (BamD/ComL family)
VAGPRSELAEDAPASDYHREAIGARDDGDIERARDLFANLVDKHPSSPDAREAEWLAATLTYQLEEYRAAKKRLVDFHETHPLAHLGELEDLLYSIGEKLYEQGKSGLMGLGILETTERGFETMKWITENLRQGSRADDALFFMARVRLDERRFEETVDYCGFLLEDYPESEWRYQAMLLKGRAHLAMNRGPAYDLDSLVKAKRELDRYISKVERNPALASDQAQPLAEAKVLLGEVARRIAEKNLLIGQWYVSQERYAAAKLYLDVAAEKHADTEAGRKARELLIEIAPDLEAEAREEKR